jgi:hypothetical protein
LLSLAWSLPGILEGTKNHNSTETQQRPNFSPKLVSSQPLVHYGQKIYESDFKNNPKHTEERKLPNASQLGFRADHSTTLRCMSLTDHVTLNFDGNILAAVIFLNIEKSSTKGGKSGLLYKLSEL